VADGEAGVQLHVDSLSKGWIASAVGLDHPSIGWARNRQAGAILFSASRFI
jgi:hypothetical protein